MAGRQVANVDSPKLMRMRHGIPKAGAAEEAAAWGPTAEAEAEAEGGSEPA